MPLAKNCNLRYQVLDRCLQSRDGMTLSQLREACNARLSIAGYNAIGPKSKNTILGDLEFMANYYNAPIRNDRIGRYVYYRYEDSGFSIFKSTLPEEDLMKIHQTLQMLGDFEGRVNFEWMEDVKMRLNMLLKDSPETPPVIGFDDNPELAGKSHLTTLYDAIRSRRAVAVSYRSFSAASADVLHVSPYYLKQYNGRWFLLCRNDGYSNITVMALDRIESIGPSHVSYMPDGGLDFAEYFDDIVGVTRRESESPQEVILWIRSGTYPYIATKPLHWSQRVIDRDDDGVTVSVTVIPNFELEQLILSYGEAVMVISPASLRERMMKRIEDSLSNYQSVQFD